MAKLGSALILPVSVSRHLVSTSAQFGQSAAGKTESDQCAQLAMSAIVLRWPSSAARSGPDRRCENKSRIHGCDRCSGCKFGTLPSEELFPANRRRQPLKQRNFRRHPQFTGSLPGVCTGPSFKIPGKHPLPRNDSRKPVDSFCSAGNGREAGRKSDSPASFC